MNAVARAWAALDTVADPEIPVVSIRELGILREVLARHEGVEVVITPTYSGCPAMGQIEDDVRAALRAQDIAAIVTTRLAPAWSTDWITPQARDKLRAYGIAPPHATADYGPDPQDGRDAPRPARDSANVVRFMPRRTGARNAAPVACPRCGSRNTSETSYFGSTACKALYKCLDCLEPFDYFKPF